jgi:hypothetical protein
MEASHPLTDKLEKARSNKRAANIAPLSDSAFAIHKVKGNRKSRVSQKENKSGVTFN